MSLIDEKYRAIVARGASLIVVGQQGNRVHEKLTGAVVDLMGRC